MRCPGEGRGFLLPRRRTFGPQHASEEEEQGDGHQSDDHVEDPVGWAGVTGEFHVEKGLKAPEKRCEEHGEDQAEKEGELFHKQSLSGRQGSGVKGIAVIAVLRNVKKLFQKKASGVPHPVKTHALKTGETV